MFFSIRSSCNKSHSTSISNLRSSSNRNSTTIFKRSSKFSHLFHCGDSNTIIVFNNSFYSFVSFRISVRGFYWDNFFSKISFILSILSSSMRVNRVLILLFSSNTPFGSTIFSDLSSS